ncbi:MAG: fibrobacter succinogenes major paralogous domain-containing protein [Bacteroidales bacterium]|nr:fibrobacter succinogenes major paralogous domain-containing protein [Bacteroidales bacterium]
MKKYFFLLIITFFAVTVSMAQIQKIAYQAVVRDTNNKLLVNGNNISLKWEVMNISNNVIYTETHTNLSTNDNGLLTLTLGDSTKGIGSWGAVEWFNARTRTTISFNGHSIVSPIETVSAVPYSITAEVLNPNGYTMKKIYYDIDTAKTNIRHSLDTAINNIRAEMHTADSALQTNIDTTAANVRSALEDSTTVLRTELLIAIKDFLASDTILKLTHDTAQTLRSELAAAIVDLITSNEVQNLIRDSLSHYTTISHLNDTLSHFAANSQNSDTAKFAFLSDTANYVIKTTYADTALFLKNAPVADTTIFAYHSDTSTFSYNANNSIIAIYSDTTFYSHKTAISQYSFSANLADSAQTSNYANTSGFANYADTTRIAYTANYADTSTTAIYADSSDYNRLANRPTGTNRGDILYWEPDDSSWHVIPVGNSGETLTLDTNHVPHWTAATPANLPTAVTDSVIDITTNTARVVSTITDDGGSAFVFSGVCWDITNNPTTTNFHTLDGLGTGSITSYLTGLSMGITYYVRAFAIGSTGTSYGNELTFRAQTYPTVTTNAISNISATSATSGGIVTDDGGAPITERGVCWSTSPSPTIADSHTSDGAGIGEFTTTLTYLNGNTTYYVRAYATNYIGTSYGDTFSFTTIGLPPTVTTSEPSNITGTTAIIGGNVVNDGWVPVTERGICWNTVGTPTMADNVITSGNDTGSFSVNINGLTSLSKYYVRAYAINAIDTSYGAEISFSTSWMCGDTISDYDNNIYNTLLIGTQCWMKENLRTTHYSNGTSITLGSSTNSTTAYIYYPDNDANNVSIYGYLYNWPAVMNGAASSSANPSMVQGVCPKDWHVPSHSEWTQLTDYVSSQNQYWCGSNSTYIAKALSSISGWQPATTTNECYPSINTYDNDATGFNGLPAGLYNGSSTSYLGEWAGWWSCTVSSGNSIHRRSLLFDSASVTISTSDKYFGRSVRCVKD